MLSNSSKELSFRYPNLSHEGNLPAYYRSKGKVSLNKRISLSVQKHPPQHLYGHKNKVNDDFCSLHILSISSKRTKSNIKFTWEQSEWGLCQPATRWCSCWNFLVKCIWRKEPPLSWHNTDNHKSTVFFFRFQERVTASLVSRKSKFSHI